MAISVKEVVQAAAELVGRGDLAKEAEAVSPSDEALLLVKCFNLVENEVALDYFPIKKTEELTPLFGKISYTRLSEAPLSIQKITDLSGMGVAFSQTSTYLDFGKYDEPVLITYAIAPKKKTLGGQSDCGEKVSLHMLAYGVAAEYLLACGRYSEASAFDKKYRAALRSAAAERKILTVRARRWA